MTTENKQTVWATMSSNGGDHVPDNINSIWSTREKAIEEAQRLSRKSHRVYGVLEVEIDKSQGEYPLDFLEAVS